MIASLSMSIVLACVPASTGDPEPQVIEVGGDVRQAVSERNRVYVAAGSAGFKVVDVALGKVVLERRLDDEVVAWLAIGDGRGFLLGEGRGGYRLHEVRLKDASLARTIDLGSELARRVELAAPDLVVVVGSTIRVVDLATGEIVARVTEDEGAVIGSDADGGRVAVTRVYPGGLWIFDRAEPKKHVFRELVRWPHHVRLLGDLAFLKDGSGTWRLDLKTGEAADLDLRIDDLARSDDGRIWARAGRSIHRIDLASLRHEEVLELPERLDASGVELLEVRGGRALLKSGAAIVLISLPVSEPGAGR